LLDLQSRDEVEQQRATPPTNIGRWPIATSRDSSDGGQESASGHWLPRSSSRFAMITV